MEENRNLSTNQNTQNNDNYLNKKLKKLQKIKIREEVKRLKEEHEYEKYVVSGIYTDKINYLKNSYVYGIINETQYNEKAKLLNDEKIVEVNKVDELYKQKIQEAKNLNLKIDDIDILELNRVEDGYRTKAFFNALLSKFKNKTFLYILKRLFLAMITLSLIIFFIILLLSFIPDTKFYDVPQYNKIKNGSANGKELADAFKNAELYKFNRVNASGSRVSIFTQFFTYIYWLLPIPKHIVTAYDPSSFKPISTELYYTYFGNSINENKLITTLIQERAGVSFTISITTLILTYLFAYPLGIAMSRKPGSLIDKIGNLFIVINYSVPALVFYLFMNKIFGIGIGNLSFGFEYDSTSLATKALTLFPPIFCITFLGIPGTTIWVRRFMVDQLNSDYVKFATSKGLSSNRVLYTHVLRNAIVPLVRSIPGSLIFAFVGSYFVESIWKIPGTGLLLVNSLSVNKPDVMVILGLTTIYSGLGMLALLLGDITTVFADPRIKLRKE